MSSLTQPGDGITPKDINNAASISVSRPGANMLWVEIDWADGTTDQFSTKSTPQNNLLYNQDQYTFEGKSLYTILFGDAHSRVILEDDPFVAVKPGPYRDTYRIWFDSEVESVLTPTDASHTVLKGIIELTDENDPTKLETLYTTIRENQINRNAIIALYEHGHYPNDHRIEPKADGLVIDDMLLLTWQNEFHLYTDTWSDGAFTPHGDPKEKPGEFREITVKEVHGDRTLEIDGVTYQMTADEHTFNRRVHWMLNWQEHLDDGEVECMKRTVPIIQKYNV